MNEIAPQERAELIERKATEIFGDRIGNGGFIRDLCFTVWHIAKQPNGEDGGASDWGTDTLPTVNAGIVKLKGMTDELITAVPEQSAPAPPVQKGVREALQQQRDYISDVAEGHVFYKERRDGCQQMARDDLAALDELLAALAQTQAGEK